jgi:hypothetical protein
MLSKIHFFLRSKLLSLTQNRQELAEDVFEDDDAMLNWVVITGSIARLAEELIMVERRIEKSTKESLT